MILAFGAWGEAATDPGYIEGEALVVLRGELGEGVHTRAAVEASATKIAGITAKTAGASVKSVYTSMSSGGGKVFALFKSDSKTTDQLIADLKANPDVLAASPNRVVRALATTPNDTHYSKQWGLTAMKAPEAWDITSRDSSVTVAVIDTGVLPTHEDLAVNLDIPHSKNFVEGKPNFTDENGHGTHVSGIIGAVGDNGIGIAGVNWNAKIITLRVLDDKGEGDVSATIAALDHVMSLISSGVNIKAVNMSLGGGYSGVKSPGDLLGTAEYMAFKELDSMKKAPLIVVAAGNDGVDVGKPNNGVIEAPAAFIGLKNFIVVGSINKNGAASDFSNWNDKHVHFEAPGGEKYGPTDGNIYSTYHLTNSSYEYLGGTSMATPFVTGAVALVASRPAFTDPDATSAQLKRALINAADKANTPSPNGSGGRLSKYGLIDLEKAVKTSALPAIPSTVSSLSVSAPSKVSVGDTFYAAAEVEPFDTSATVTWSSDNTDVATVEPDGSITAKSVGSVTITGTAGGFSKTATINVVERSPDPVPSEKHWSSGGCDSGALALAAMIALAGALALKKARGKI